MILLIVILHYFNILFIYENRERWGGRREKETISIELNSLYLFILAIFERSTKLCRFQFFQSSLKAAIKMQSEIKVAMRSSSSTWRLKESEICITFQINMYNWICNISYRRLSRSSQIGRNFLKGFFYE